ncbi:hypothetical protein VTJ49DRAFT_3360 [Mycothermus thermophilus]|uniref:Uncharacterized protein n=1 Tax=Humicola insolens TaxID=85995 RepID=A0ABR3V7Y3_HUMIN
MADGDSSPPARIRPRPAARHSTPSRFDVPDIISPGADGALGITAPDPDARSRPSVADLSHDRKRHSSAIHRQHKARPSGGFLLADTLPGRRDTHQDADLVVSDRSREGSAARQSVVDSAAQLDMEAAQIVNMALNLSESRRLAARRHASQHTPPRLVPLPDAQPSAGLRFHLQQQRRTSRTASPKPDPSPRIGAARVFTPLQPAFEPAYRYHFSTSTLARAQRAKEYLELMAQYRRVLDLLPPLEPDRFRAWSASPPTTPGSSAPVSRVTSREADTRLGRPYNPLQYIRNRKVRARERRTIDGEELGFNDVVRVSEWVDEVARWVATGQARAPGNPTLPPFPAATAALEMSPSASSKSLAKPRRPRVDWTIDPADMLADVYWLELDDNKELVEDRHGRRVFPHVDPPRLSTPASRYPADAHSPADKTPDNRHEHEHVLSAARDRAQQKLRALKGSHHRHTSSVAHRDRLRRHRGSMSESSDADTDRRRAVRSVLEKRMEEVIAREQREAESHPLFDPATGRIRDPAMPEPPPSPNHFHADPLAGLSDAESSAPRLPRSSYAGRASLEVPGSRRPSIGADASRTCSPALRPVHGGDVPAIGVEVSPASSRPSSPHRNPLNKVRSIFRDRSKERPEPRPDDGLVPSSNPALEGLISITPETTNSGVLSPQRKSSRSPAGERGHRPSKSLGGARLRGDDGGISFRSLLRGPRIETVLRSGVSKVSDILWRKDEDSCTSDSEAEARGRTRVPLHGRSFSAIDATLPPGTQTASEQNELQLPPARPLSQRSSRFELLKPPRIDIQRASPSVSPPPVLVRLQPPDAETDQAQPDPPLPEPRPSIPADVDRTWSDKTFKPIPSDTAPPHPSHSPIISRRDLARLQTLLLTTGIRAAELDRRAHQRRPPPKTLLPCHPRLGPSPAWLDIARLACPNDRSAQQRLLSVPLAATELYPCAARALVRAAEKNAAQLEEQSSKFLGETAPALRQRADALREKVAEELGALAQQTADEADEAQQDLLVGQRLKVKRVVDAMDKMLRRRRRRFRWVRRAGWLAVEWLLVGCMWYVWFLVMIVRMVVGAGKGVVRGVKWLLWL